MSLCLPSPRRMGFFVFAGNSRFYLSTSVVGLTAFLAGCGGHSSTPVNTAGYVFNNFDITNATGGTIPTGINNNGVLIGYTTAIKSPFTSFFRNADGTFTTLVLNNGGSDISNQVNANGFNDSNLVVGAIVGITSAAPGSTAFVDNPVTNPPVAVLPPVTSTTTTQTALGVNNGGVVVGQYFDSSTGNTPGFLWANSTYTTIDPAPALGAASGITYAQAINNNNIVVGSYAANGSTFQHGFEYSMSTGQYSALPDPSTTRTTASALASVRFMSVNDKNEAAGYYQTANGSQYAFVFDLTTQTYTFLDDPSAAEATLYNNIQSTRITGINNAATICGTYTDANNVSHAFIAPLH